jgi:outer membrane lipoprotein LolB
MKRLVRGAGRFAAGVVFASVLAGCGASRSVRDDHATPALEGQRAREVAVRAAPAWTLTGRIAVSDGRDGGSGRIVWRQDGDRFSIEIKAPVSRRTWRLSGEPGHAVLEGLDGGPRHGTDAESLLRREVGWSVPFAHLADWARGLRGDGGAQIEFDQDRRPARLHQRGWTVEYRGWNDSSPSLPTRVFAASGERRVRVVVERWDPGASRG